MSALICGSYAYDTIMVFHDQFKNHILPDKVHMLNVSFLVPEMRREFGGCAGNIAFTLHMLGGDALPMATVGSDFAPYAAWMDKHKMNRKYLKEVDSYTGQAFITTDMDDNQITAFHPGAMGFSHENKVADAAEATIGIISPDGRDGMIQHAIQFVEQDVAFIFDPGQGMPMFNGEELSTFIDQATYVTVNDYEGEMLAERTGKSLEDIAKQVKALIVTRGGEGSDIYADGKCIKIPLAKISAAQDPTGCGDAFRGGLLYGMMNGMDWDTSGRIASLCGAIKIEQLGPQNHSFTMDEFKARYKENFGSEF